ncbi:MAG: Gfo/Idh/MocA family oxidoreductase [Anaerolineae bacterium]|nr:Gfo/Idh/MocA family oxidoreductase [Anaerolineae bacterium]
MIPFAIIGTGWRAEFYLRIARECPDRFKIAGVVTRDVERASTLLDPFGVQPYASLDDLLANEKPLFVVTSVPWAVNPHTLQDLAHRGIPALSETPPATTVQEMFDLWRLTAGGAKIQVAEQYWAQPLHAARIAFAHSGRLGQITQAQVSAAHGYHGVSLIRRLLGIGYENATITAHHFQSPIVESPTRNGPPEVENIVPSDQTLAWLDFGGRLGVFDFSGDQYFSYIRGNRVLVRGERGQIIDEQATYLQDFRTPIQAPFIRHVAGPNGNLEGHYLKGIQVGEAWIYRNPLAPAMLTDDEIAIGDCLLRMADYADGGPSFYDLAEACQDRYLDIMIAEAAKGQPVTTTTQPWAV